MSEQTDAVQEVELKELGLMYPRVTKEQIDDVVDLAIEIKLDGLVATNTTISRENLKTSKKEIDEIGNGGLSGKPVKEMSTHVVNYLIEKWEKVQSSCNK